MKYILFVFFGILISSQNNRFIYEVLYKSDSTSENITKEIFHLDIDTDEIRYYNRSYYINDSLYQNTKQYGYAGYRLSSFIIRETKEQSYHSYEYIGDVNFYKITEIPKQNWSINDSTKVFEGFNVQKATLEFGGRTWTAWFSKDIPFPYGPYKFSGLPGLIIEIEDKRGDYKFKLIGSKNNYPKYKPISLDNAISNSIPTNWNKLNKLKLRLYHNPFLYILNGRMTIPEGKKLELDDGTILSKEQLKPAEKKEQIKIKSKNNPIELDKGIKYPN